MLQSENKLQNHVFNMISFNKQLCVCVCVCVCVCTHACMHIHRYRGKGLEDQWWFSLGGG